MRPDDIRTRLTCGTVRARALASLGEVRSIQNSDDRPARQADRFHQRGGRCPPGSRGGQFEIAGQPQLAAGGRLKVRCRATRERGTSYQPGALNRSRRGSATHNEGSGGRWPIDHPGLSVSAGQRPGSGRGGRVGTKSRDRRGRRHDVDFGAGEPGDRGRQRFRHHPGRFHPRPLAAAEQLGQLGGLLQAGRLRAADAGLAGQIRKRWKRRGRTRTSSPRRL